MPTGLLFATSAHAQRAHKAQQIKLDMIAAYNQCTAPTLTHPPAVGPVACSPVLSTTNNLATQLTFGPAAN